MSENLILGIISLSLGFVVVVATIVVLFVMWRKDEKEKELEKSSSLFDVNIGSYPNSPSKTRVFEILWSERGCFNSLRFISYRRAISFFNDLLKRQDVNCLRLVLIDEV